MKDSIILILTIPFYLGLVITTILHWSISVPLLTMYLYAFGGVSFKDYIKGHIKITKILWGEWI